jgi:hypothetical protein
MTLVSVPKGFEDNKFVLGYRRSKCLDTGAKTVIFSFQAKNTLAKSCAP